MMLGGPARYAHVADEVLAAASVVVGPLDVVYVTEGLDIAWISESVTHALGWQPEDLVGLPALSLVSPNQDRSFVDANRHRLLAGRDVIQRLLVRAKDGTESWFTGVAHPTPPDAGSGGFVVVLHELGEDGPTPTVAALDEVTGADGRRAIIDYIDRSLMASPSLCILTVEFQNLRVINESLGHSAGDDALVELVHRIRRSFTRGERIGRVSGRTFLVCCLDVSGTEDLRSRTLRLVDEWAAEINVAGRRIEPDLVASVVQSRPTSTALTLLRDADVALSDARRRGSIVSVFSAEMSERTMRRFVIEDELRFALDAEEFDLHYQPIVSLIDGTPVAAEALVRWRHPREGMLSPASFLPIAEESRLIRPIGRRLLVRALEALKSLPPHALQIGVNVSAVQLADESWLDSVVYAIDRSGVDPCCLVMELTETAVFEARRDVASDFHALRSMGVGLFLDDFGTGYSSLALLRDVPLTGIKLDKSFVSTLGDQESFGARLSQGLVQLMRTLDITGIAEGIETSDQADRLRDMGWEFGQGYYYGRPGPFNELPRPTADRTGITPH
jgi:diguanylate cyclase (GGDEF)-like protein/PAS domain S-box-containing protein